MDDTKFAVEDRCTRACGAAGLPFIGCRFLPGLSRQPVGGFPEPLRTKVIRNKPRIDGRPGVGLEPLDFKKIKAELRSKFGKHISDADVTSYVMYPKVRAPVSRVARASDYAVRRSSKSTKGSCRNMVT